MVSTGKVYTKLMSDNEQEKNEMLKTIERTGLEESPYFVKGEFVSEWGFSNSGHRVIMPNSWMSWRQSYCDVMLGYKGYNKSSKSFWEFIGEFVPFNGVQYLCTKKSSTFDVEGGFVNLYPRRHQHPTLNLSTKERLLYERSNMLLGCKEGNRDDCWMLAEAYANLMNYGKLPK